MKVANDMRSMVLTAPGAPLQLAPANARQTRSSGRRKVATIPADCAAAFQKIALDCVARVRAHRGGVFTGDTEAVHQIRVAFTQLRAAVSFFAPMTVDADWRGLKKEFAWLNASLGAARDSDVMVAYVRRKRYGASAKRGIGQQLARRQTRDHRRLVRALKSRRFKGLIDALSGWIGHGRWLLRWERNGRGKPATSLEAYCERKLNRWRQQLIRKGRHLETLGASRRHRLRIRAKRFRYMLEALTGIVPLRGRGEFRHLHRPAKRLQRSLGDLRDLERLVRLGISAEDGSPASKSPDHRQRRKKLLHAAVEAYQELKQAGAC